jgi:hypothetical protein
MDESHNWVYDSFAMYVPVLSKSKSVHLVKKAVAFERSCLYSVASVLFIRWWDKSFCVTMMCANVFHCQEIPWDRMDCSVGRKRPLSRAVLSCHF